MKQATNLDIILLSAIGAILGYLFFPALRETALICIEKDDYSHGQILPLVSLYMVWDRRADIAKRLKAANFESKLEKPLIIPLIGLFIGLFLWCLGVVAGLNYISWLGFSPTTLSIVALIFGRTFFWSVASPILLLLMAKPLPDSLILRIFWPLQVVAAKVSALVLELLGVPVFLSGNVIEIPSMKLLVEEACSGMRSAIALITLAFIVTYFLEMRFFYKCTLVVMALLVAIVLNVMRVASTGVLAHFVDPKAAEGFFHTFSGLIVFGVALLILWLIGKMLIKLDSRTSTPAQ